MNEAIADAVVVGAGPAGAALSYLLASRGLRTTLIERHTDFGREFRGEGLQPSGLACLHMMGLEEPFSRVPQSRPQRMRIYNGRSCFVVPMPDGELRPCMVSQPGLLEMLVAEAARFPGFHLARGVGVRDLVHEEGRVVGVVTTEQQSPLRARLVIGADGRGSLVRRKTSLPVTDLQQVFDILWMKVDLGEFLPDRDTGHMEAAGPQIIVYPSPEGHHQVGVVLAKELSTELTPEQRWEWIGRQASPELADALRRAERAISGPVLLKVVCDRLERWSEPGVLLIGDAAHAMSPVGGQGINMALRDAVIAANHLVPALRDSSPETVDRACHELAEERLGEIRRMQELQTLEGRRLRRPSKLALRVVLPLLARFGPGLLTRANRRRASMRTGLTDVALVV
jgi:2-polyprenyl-6-methoxyphenol hydroxylase-like FAD-dependent oxidoreductase